MTTLKFLLLTYPREYRRDRGEEMIGLMLDLGKIRPTWREALNLLSHGLRARLGRPASRSVVVWAAVTSVFCGLLLACAATFAAWQTAEPLPSRAEAHDLMAEMLVDRNIDTTLRVSPALFVFYEEPLGWEHFGSVLSGDGGELTFGSASAAITANSIDLANGVHERLRASGWKTVVTSDPHHEKLILARRGADIIEVTYSSSSYLSPSSGPGYLSVSLSRDTPWLVHPAGIAGFLLGVLLAWFVFGWASRRTERKPIAKSLFGVTLFFWCVPLWAFPLVVMHHVEETHFRWHPLWEFIGQPGMSMFLITGAIPGALCLAIAAIPSRKADRHSITSVS